MGSGAAALNPSARERLAPWLEGGFLALLLLIVVSLGGDSLRTSNHGTLHAGIGEAVLREGLLPENPYHAGEPLRYYLLYPGLGALLGRAGMGPLWGFALLNLLAGLLLGPALDAFGKSLGLSFRGRRIAFLGTIFALNGLGWLWGGPEGGPILDFRSFDEPGPGVALGAMPLALLQRLADGPLGLSWDARLQSFLPKFLNVSSFALALPFTLWCMAFALREAPRALLASAAHLGVATALNPLAAVPGAVLLIARNLRRLRAPAAAARALAPAVGLALLIAAPFLLSFFARISPGEGTVQPKFRLAGDGPLANLTGPLLLLWPVGVTGFFFLSRGHRWSWLAPFAASVALSVVALDDWENQYKFVRLAGLLLAVAGAAALDRLAGRWWGALGCLLLLLATLPTTWLTVRAYAAWDATAALTLTRVEEGRLALAPEYEEFFPAELRAAEAALPADAPLLADPTLNPSGLQSTTAIGHPLVPLLHRPLFVDLPQIHNMMMPDLEARLAGAYVFFYGRMPPTGPGDVGLPARPEAALMDLRAALPGRPLGVLVSTQQVASIAALERAGAERRASAAGLELWLLPPPPAASGN